MNTQVLVLGDDGSEAADVAWLWVNEHPWCGWRIEVVTVDSRVATWGWAPMSPHRVLQPWVPVTRRVLLTGQGRTEVQHLTCDGDPRVVLNQLGYAQLMVIGHRGRGRLKAVSLGSTSDWLLRRPPAPLLVIRSARPTRRILLCVDGSPDAQQAANVLAALPWIDGVEVVVLSVDDGATRPHVAIEAAEAVLRDAGAATTAQSRESLSHSLSFSVRSTILRFLAQDNYDLVAVGTRGLAHSVLRGSVAAAVTHNAPCSVLVARADNDDEPAREQA